MIELGRHLSILVLRGAHILCITRYTLERSTKNADDGITETSYVGSGTIARVVVKYKRQAC